MTSTKPFSFDTIENFDQHIDNSIPNYSLLQNAIVSISEFVTVPHTTVLDLGCSTGTLLKRIKHTGRKVGVDWSDNLLPKSTETEEFVNVDITKADMCQWGKTSLVSSIFTLQFLPKDTRYSVLSSVFQSLCEGGVFVWAEKVLCDSGWQQELMTFSYYDYKQTSFSAEEILGKEQDLRQLMRCNSSDENQGLAYEAGFEQSQMLWKFFNFECWLYRKV